jgi:PTS system cellobiose-specific IIA component
MNYEEKIMQLIVNGGNAKSKSIEAIHIAREGKNDEARALLEMASVDLAKAHEIQMEFIEEEANGHAQEVTILMVHAQDHLMNAITVKDLAAEFIDLYEKVHSKK